MIMEWECAVACQLEPAVPAFVMRHCASPCSRYLWRPSRFDQTDDHLEWMRAWVWGHTWECQSMSAWNCKSMGVCTYVHVHVCATMCAAGKCTQKPEGAMGCTDSTPPPIVETKLSGSDASVTHARMHACMHASMRTHLPACTHTCNCTHARMHEQMYLFDCVSVSVTLQVSSTMLAAIPLGRPVSHRTYACNGLILPSIPNVTMRAAIRLDRSSWPPAFMQCLLARAFILMYAYVHADAYAGASTGSFCACAYTYAIPHCLCVRARACMCA